MKLLITNSLFETIIKEVISFSTEIETSEAKTTPYMLLYFDTERSFSKACNLIYALFDDEIFKRRS